MVVYRGVPLYDEKEAKARAERCSLDYVFIGKGYFAVKVKATLKNPPPDR